MAKATEQQHVKCHVYTINQDCQLVHVSKETLALFPHVRLGEACYSALRGEDAPCEDCPWRSREFESEGCIRKVVYNSTLHQWLELTCMSVHWPNEGKCTVIASRGIDESNTSVFSQFTEQTMYDKVVEINLGDNTFRYIYFEQGKYELPLFTNSLDSIVDIAELIIHPEDRQGFIKFWSPASIKRRLKQGEREIRGEFRQKLKSGTYHWTSQTLLPVDRIDTNEIVLMCFTLDIEVQKQRSATEIEVKKQQFKALYERDPLTGLYRTEAFFEKASELLARHRSTPYEILCLDMKSFRLFNEWYGRDAGDRLLRVIAKRFKDIKRTVPSIAGYFGADNFGLVLPQGTGFEEELNARIEMPSLDFEDSIGFFPVMGVCKIEEDAISLRTVFDRATTTKNLIKQSYATRIGWYEESEVRQIDEDVKLLLEIQHALSNREFLLYWQPQCDMRNGRIVGAEALVRWRHPDRGLIPPSEFIPLLEKTGFIVNLDLFVWEEACRQLCVWIDQGLRPVPISINVSQTDLYSIDVPGTMKDLVKKYDLSPALLKLEITESAFADGNDVANMATQLKEFGLAVLMDDFGSGYSSLNMLKNIDIDILKLDMSFLDWNEDSAGRGENIVEAIFRMTNLMDLRVIAEGVETKRQVDFLTGIGCNYAQGYHFFRPMPAADFGKLLHDAGRMDYGGIRKDPIKLIDLEDLIKGEISNKSVLDNILGGIAIYAINEGRYELFEVNRQYRRILGDDAESMDRHRFDVVSSVHPDDVDLFKGLFVGAQQHTISGAEAVFRRLRCDGSYMWIMIRLFFLGKQDSKCLFYGALTDVTEWREQKQALQESEDALHLSRKTAEEYREALAESQLELKELQNVPTTAAE